MISLTYEILEEKVEFIETESGSQGLVGECGEDGEIVLVVGLTTHSLLIKFTSDFASIIPINSETFIFYSSKPFPPLYFIFKNICFKDYINLLLERG